MERPRWPPQCPTTRRVTACRGVGPPARTQRPPHRVDHRCPGAPRHISDRFSEALIERAEAGVEVNVVLDGYGSAELDGDRLDRLERSGVNVSIFRPPSWYHVRKLNNRMHRRVLVLDGTLGFVGGVGIADVWTGDADDPSHWRETHLRVEGPAVTELLGAFLENWTEATGGLLSTAHVPEITPFGRRSRFAGDEEHADWRTDRPDPALLRGRRRGP